MAHNETYTPYEKMVIGRFERFHDRMVREDKRIPFSVMREYLDVLAYAKDRRPGLHNKTITVTRNPVEGLLNWDLMLESDIVIRIEGQKW